MNGPHSVLEAALEYGNVPEDIRRSLRVEMGYELALWATDFVDLDGFDEALGSLGQETPLPETWRIEKDPDLWIVRDERGDVVCGVSAETAMEEAVHRVAREHVAARKEIGEEADGG